MSWGLLASAMAFMAPAFADLPCDVDASGAVDAVDVQLVINGALRLDTRPYFTDVDSSGAIDAMDVQLAINAALRLAVVLTPRVNVFTLGQGQVVVDPAAETYVAGTVVTLTPAPGVGWLFDHWEGDLSGADNPASVTVTAPMNIFAVFVQVGQQGLASQHIAQLQSTAPRLGWTFTVGETDAAGYPFTSVTGLIPPPPGYQDGAKKMTIPDAKVALPAAFDWRDQGKVPPIRDLYHRSWQFSVRKTRSTRCILAGGAHSAIPQRTCILTPTHTGTVRRMIDKGTRARDLVDNWVSHQGRSTIPLLGIGLPKMGHDGECHQPNNCNYHYCRESLQDTLNSNIPKF